MIRGSKYGIAILFVSLTILSVLFSTNVFSARAGGNLKPVLIGILHNGNFPFASMMKDSFEMALEKINEEGGINGKPLKLLYTDDLGKPDEGERVVRQIVKKEGAAILVGGYSSSNTVYMAGMAEKLGMPFLITTAADDRITQRKWKNVYRLNPPASGYTQGLEDLFLNQIKPESMAIVYENSPYGTGGALRMMWFCREQGIEITKIIPYHRERLKKAYFNRILSPLSAGPPDVIYMVSYLKDAVTLVKTIRGLGIPSLLAGGAGGFTHPNFIPMAGKEGERVITATLWFQKASYSGIKKYFSEYKKRYGAAPDYHAAEAYSALLVAADALRRAKTLTPADIRAALDETDLMTPFGPVKFASFDKFQRQNVLPTQVLQVIEGKIRIIWPKELATETFSPPPYWRGSK
jgi:branched-chain amino acid transport system substrate-binding protein